MPWGLTVYVTCLRKSRFRCQYGEGDRKISLGFTDFSISNHHRFAYLARPVLVLSCGCLAGLLAIMMFQGNLRIVVGALGGVLLVGSLVVSGNPRLALLWGMLVTLPLALNKSFMIEPHMGGAASLSIDACDVFLFPLTVLIFKDYLGGIKPKIVMPKVIYWWLALTALGMVDCVLGPMRTVAFLEVVRMLKLTWLFLVLVNELCRLRQFHHVLQALMFCVLMQASVGLIQWAFELNLGAQILGEVTWEQAEYTSKATYFESEFTYRVGGLIGHPNLLAIFLAMLVPMGMCALFSPVSTIQKTILGSICAMGVAALVLTLSRSGWISFGLAMAVLLWASFALSSMNKQYILSKMGFLVCVLVLLALMSGPIIKRLTQSDGGAVDFRWEWMTVSLRMILDRPFFGFGLNSFVWFMPPYTDYLNYGGVVEKFGTDLPVVHNIYLLIAVEQGLIGLGIFLGFYLHLMWIAICGLRRYTEPFLSMMNLGCLCALVALSFDGVASFFIRNDNCGRIFFCVAGVLVAIQLWHKNRQPRSSQDNGLRSFANV